MCGIVGIWSSEKEIKGAVLESMAEALAHRGPDDSGSFIDKSSNLGFAHRRLSIVDLSPQGHQPMSNEDGSLWITYNGEVYNFKSIREELIRKGHRFRSDTDTEVVLKSFEEWGIECAHKFIGMFAVGIWDKKSRKLYLLRDRAGVKPLYYYNKNGLFLFGSELKALFEHPEYEKEIDLDALAVYFKHGYIPAPGTIFQNTFKLRPGHYLCLSDSNNLEEIKYWDAADYYLQEPFNKSEDEITEELESLLLDSFKYRLVADVPIGAFLSGGIDSTTLCALLQKNMGSRLKTYSIGFYENSFNEAEWAKKIAQYLGTEHTEYYVSGREAFDIVHKLPEIYDEPFADNSAIPTYLVSKLTRESAKVALSADGGDELFCGYRRYWQVNKMHSMFSTLPGFLKQFSVHGLEFLSPEVISGIYNSLSFALPKTKNFRDKYKKLIHMLKSSKRGNLSSMYEESISLWASDDLKKIIDFHYDSNSESNYHEIFRRLKNQNLFNRMMLTDFKTYLPGDILAKLDRASMTVSLEGRDPFLDHRLVEYASRIPIQLKYKNNESKYILRKILYKHVPESLLNRPKQGFSAPIHFWFKKEFGELLHIYLSPNRLKESGLLNHKAVNSLVDEFLKGSTVNINTLWTLLMFEMWRDKWLVAN